ncbi:MAG: hypothetical protein ABI462_14585 [Ignavibacteria bacterium]
MLKAISFIFIFSISITITSNAQMNIPAALENKVLDSMVGEWVADSEMMGMPFIQNVKIYWGLNHQFLIVETQATAKDNTSISFERKDIIGIDDKGNAKTWKFDSWGAGSVSTGTGFFDGDVVTITEGNDVFKQTTVATVNGNEMVINAKGSIVTSGKDIGYDNSTTFRRK